MRERRMIRVLVPFSRSLYYSDKGRERGITAELVRDNVEMVVSERIGIETTTYVRNIYKYYTAYKLQADLTEERRKAREQVAPGKK